MLTTIREKAQGAFAWVILIAICIPFALWGIQNYTDSSSESPVASVGGKDFYQRDVTNAYEQYAQNFRGMNIDEKILKQQALDKLIKDEVLLQYVQSEGLTATDSSTRDFIKNLPYFQTDGKFDDKLYRTILSGQKMVPASYEGKIKNNLMMVQFQRTVTDSSFTTNQAVESFFKIQNQQRDVEYITIPVAKLSVQPSEQEIADYYQKHQDSYKVPEQTSVEYVELTLEDLAKNVSVTDDKLHAYYEEQKDQYTSKQEERKISHILFAINAKTDDKTALEKATKALEALKTKDFATVAAELSDDKMTAKKGGELGVFTTGSLDKSFDKSFVDATKSLKQDEVSKPVRSSFGYHLIKINQFSAAQIKPFESVKAELTKNYQKAQTENAFYEAGEKLAQLSYENPDSLQAVASNLKLEIKKTGLFSKDKGDGIAAEQKLRDVAFSEEVQQGNNSTPVEMGSDRLVVLRQLERKPAAVRDLNTVKQDVITALINEKANQLTLEMVATAKQRIQSGETMQKVAADLKLTVKEAKGLTRNKPALPEILNDAVFKAAKPVAGKPSIFSVALPTGEQALVSLSKVMPGVMSDDDKKQLELAKKNLARAFGNSEFDALVATLQATADITVKN